MEKNRLLPQMDTARYGNQPPRPRPEPVQCTHIPACASCTLPGHGFVCHFEDGGCLRFPKGQPDAPVQNP